MEIATAALRSAKREAKARRKQERTEAEKSEKIEQPQQMAAIEIFASVTVVAAPRPDSEVDCSRASSKP